MSSSICSVSAPGSSAPWSVGVVVVLVLVLVVVAHQLEAPDVAGEVLVLVEVAVDLGLVLGHRPLERTARARRADQLAHPLGQGQRRLRRGDLRGVGGHGRPQRQRVQAELLAGVVQDADDARRALVLAALQVEAVDERLVGGGADERDGLAVHDVGQQRAEGDHQPGPGLLGDARDLVGEGPPAQLGLDAEHEHDVAAGRRRGVRVVRRPRDAAGVAVDQVDLGPGRLEVVVLLGVDAGDRLRAPLLDQVADGERRGVAGVVPAGEGGDHRRAAEGRAAAPDHVLHRSRRYRPSGPARRGPAGTVCP